MAVVVEEILAEHSNCIYIYSYDMALSESLQSSTAINQNLESCHQQLVQLANTLKKPIPHNSRYISKIGKYFDLESNTKILASYLGCYRTLMNLYTFGKPFIADSQGDILVIYHCMLLLQKPYIDHFQTENGLSKLTKAQIAIPMTSSLSAQFNKHTNLNGSKKETKLYYIYHRSNTLLMKFIINELQMYAFLSLWDKNHPALNEFETQIASLSPLLTMQQVNNQSLKDLLNEHYQKVCHSINLVQILQEIFIHPIIEKSQGRIQKEVKSILSNMSTPILAIMMDYLEYSFCLAQHSNIHQLHLKFLNDSNTNTDTDPKSNTPYNHSRDLPQHSTRGVLPMYQSNVKDQRLGKAVAPLLNPPPLRLGAI